MTRPHLDGKETMQVFSAMTKQPQRSALPARTAQRSAPTPQRATSTPSRNAALIQRLFSASHTPVRETGTRTFTGKSSFTEDRWRDHAISLAKRRAEMQYKSMLQRLEAEGKVCDIRAKGSASVNQNAVTYTITATLE